MLDPAMKAMLESARLRPRPERPGPFSSMETQSIRSTGQLANGDLSEARDQSGQRICSTASEPSAQWTLFEAVTFDGGERLRLFVGSSPPRALATHAGRLQIHEGCPRFSDFHKTARTSRTTSSRRRHRSASRAEPAYIAISRVRRNSRTACPTAAAQRPISTREKPLSSFQSQ